MKHIPNLSICVLFLLSGCMGGCMTVRAAADSSPLRVNQVSIELHNPSQLVRHEPVHLIGGPVPANPKLFFEAVDDQGAPCPAQFVGDGWVILVNLRPGEKRNLRLRSTQEPPQSAIRYLPPSKATGDEVRRIDTGYYVIGIGTGLADGSLGGKWATKAQR